MEILDQSIHQNRTAKATVALTHKGRPIVGQEISVQQKSHKFLFGANWGEGTIPLINGDLSGQEKEQAELRNEHFLNLFNQVTLPFYWSRFEPQRGHPDTRRILNVARWYKEQGCIIKGHPLCWHTLTADWLLEMSNQGVLNAQLERIRRDVNDFRDVIDQWDVVNEAVTMPVFDKYDNGITRICKEMGRIELIRSMFEVAQKTAPKAFLVLNDFDVSPAYDILVEGCLTAGIEIDGIGIQSHMHQGYWGKEKTLSVLERFERFNLPIYFTETTIVSGHLMPPEIVDLNDYQVDDWPTTLEGEERQTQEAIMHYKTLFSNPLVEGITWWDLTDGGWLNAPAGLLRRDQSRKPAYDELLKLVKGEWWLPQTKFITDTNGQITFNGFLGEYKVSIDDQKTIFSLREKGDVLISVNI